MKERNENEKNVKKLFCTQSQKRSFHFSKNFRECRRTERERMLHCSFYKGKHRTGKWKNCRVEECQTGGL